MSIPPTKSLYKPSSYSIGAYRCVALDSNDRIISGRRGWIFEAGPGRLGIVQVQRGGYEKLTYCNVKDLRDVVSRIEVLRDLAQAAYYANNPNARHDDLAAGPASDGAA